LIINFNKLKNLSILNLSSGTLIVLVNQLSILISLPFLTSFLGFEAFGILTQGLIIYQIGALCMDFGCGYSSIFFIKSDEDKNIPLEDILIPVFTIKFIIFLIILILTIISNFYLKLTSFSPALFSMIMFAIFLAGNNPIWIYQVKLENFYLLVATIIARIIFLTIIFINIRKPDDLIWYFYSLNIGFLITSFYTIFQYRKLKLTFRGFKSLFKIVRTSFSYFINSLIIFNSNSIWGLGLLILGTPAQLVYFNLADQCYRALNGLAGSIPANLYSRFTKSFDVQKSMKLALLIGILMFFVYIIFYYLIDKIIPIFFDSIYFKATPLIKIYILASLFLSLTNLFGYPIYGLVTSAKKARKLILFSGILNLLLFLVWIIVLEKTVLIIVLIHLSINILIFLWQLLLIIINFNKPKII